MVSPIDAKWANDDMGDAVLDQVTYGQGTSFPSTWPTTRLFWRTDENRIYKNIGSEGTPIWDSLTGGQANDQLYPLSTTIGDYSQPSAAVATSLGEPTPDLDDDFSGTDDWTDQGSGFAVNVGTDVIDWDAQIDGAVNGTWIDIKGSNLSDSAWVVRFKLTVDNLTQGAVATTNELHIAISDLDGTNGTNTAQDAIGFRYIVGSATNRFSIYDDDGTTLPQGTAGDEATFSLTPAAQTYFIEIIRLTTTTYIVRVFDDSTYTTLNQARSGTVAAGTVNLRYLKVMCRENSSGGDSTLDGTIDDVKVWDGLVSIPHSDKAVDDDVLTRWQSLSENNPAIYVDTGSAQEVAGIAINLDRTVTTETQIEIRYSTDATFTASERIRTIDITDFTDDTYRFISLPRQVDDRKFIQIFGKNSSKVLSINEIKYRAVTDWDREHYHSFLDPDNPNSAEDSD